MITNIKKHALAGFVAGFIGALLALQLPWMGQSGTSAAEVMTCLAGLIAWLLVTVFWEVWQWSRSHCAVEYIDLKWRDTLADLLVGNLCFWLPWIVIMLGEYAGNVLRP